MRPCFLVKVRKASGRRVAGGRMMGRTTDLEGTGGLKGLSGCAGVAKAGEEEGIPLEGGRFFAAKKGGAGGLARRGSLSGRSSGFWGVRWGLFRGLAMLIILNSLVVFRGQLRLKLL